VLLEHFALKTIESAKTLNVSTRTVGRKIWRQKELKNSEESAKLPPDLTEG